MTGVSVRSPSRGSSAFPAAAVLALSGLVGLATGILGAQISIPMALVAAATAAAFLRVSWGLVGLAAALPWYHLTAVPLLERANLTAFDAMGLVLLAALLSRKLLGSRAFPARLHATGLVLAILTCWAAFAFATSIPGGRLLLGLKPYVAVFVFYWLVYALARSDGLIRRALTAFVVATTLAELAGLAELVTGTTLLGQAAEPLRLMGASGSLEATDLTRVAGLYGDPNFYAMTALAALPAAGALYLSAQRGWKKALLLLAVAVLGLSVLVGASRGVAAAAAVAGATFLFLSRSRHRYRVLALLAVLAVALLLLVPRAYFSRLLVTGDQSSLYRLELEQVAVAAVAAQPYFGHGPDLLVYQPSISAYTYIHNTYLQIAAEGGLPALALFLAVVVAAIIAAARTHRRARAAGGDSTLMLAVLPGLAAFVVFFVFFSYYGNKTFWFLAALASAAAQLPVASRPGGSAPPEQETMERNPNGSDDRLVG